MGKQIKKKCIVDTNIPINANLFPGKVESENVPLECILKCVEIIQDVMECYQLVLDEGGEIFDEYKKNLCFSGQPGVGDRFLKWVHDNHYNSLVIETIKINKTEDGNSYNEFPAHDNLKNFDPSDKKFIAVANSNVFSNKNKPIIFEATDSKWHQWENTLNSFGIKVEFICSKYSKSIFEKKMG